ncbi:MAG: YHS domain-containing (seleno)protein [Minwuia sp.]|uniref:YHS domain-containing (seleno)protein n=1 Tax=Minwuia sp. TaxID=2493630 RepID=UPI003A83D158
MPGSSLKVAAAGLLGALAFSTGALAGEQYVDGTGYAVSGYDVVAYHSLQQAPVGDEQPAAVPGKAEFTADYNGATWAFANEANRDMFAADPGKYAPAYDGHCAFGIAKGGKVPANPHLWRIRDGKLYLNITKRVVGFWEADIPANLRSSEANWRSLEDQAAAADDVPAFDASHAPKS